MRSITLTIHEPDDNDVARVQKIVRDAVDEAVLGIHRCPVIDVAITKTTAEGDDESRYAVAFAVTRQPF